MMNKSAAIIFALAMVCVALAVSRGNVAAQSEYKIGVIDTQTALDSYDKQKDGLAKLEAEKEAHQTGLNELAESIGAAKELYDAEQERMPEDDRAALEERILSDKDRFDAEYRQFQQDLDRKFDRLRREIFAEIQEAVRSIGLEENYHLVLDGRDVFPPNLLYYAVPLDITQKVVDRLNADYEKS